VGAYTDISWVDNEEIVFDVDNLSVGIYEVEISVLDDYAHESVDSALVTVVDTLAPIFITTPDDLLYEFNSTGHTLSWTVSDANPTTYDVKINDSLIIHNEPWLDAEELTVAVDDLAVGIYEVTIEIFDEFGLSNTDTALVTVQDTIAPQFIFIPSDTTHEISAPDKIIEWIPSDASPDTYTITIDGTPILEDEPWFDNQKISLTVNVDDLGIQQTGSYQITITITDSYGLQQSDSVLVTIIDETDPIPTILYPEDGMIIEIENSTTDISYNYSIIDFSAYTVAILLNDQAIEDTGVLLGLSPGEYNLTLICEDASGNNATTDVEFFVVNIVIPDPTFEVTLITPNGGEIFTNPIISIVWQMTNPFELVATYDLQYSADGGLSWGTIAEDVETTTYKWNVSNIPAGINYVVKVTAKTTYNGEILSSSDTSDDTFTIVDESVTTTDSLSPGFTFPLVLFGFLSLALVTLFKKRAKK
jgi:hypothetical protein